MSQKRSGRSSLASSVTHSRRSGPGSGTTARRPRSSPWLDRRSPAPPANRAGSEPRRGADGQSPGPVLPGTRTSSAEPKAGRLQRPPARTPMHPGPIMPGSGGKGPKVHPTSYPSSGPVIVILMAAAARSAREAAAARAVIPRGPGEPRPASRQRDAIVIMVVLAGAASLAAQHVAMFAIVLAAIRVLVRDSQVIPHALTWLLGPAPDWYKRRNLRYQRQQRLGERGRLLSVARYEAGRRNESALRCRFWRACGGESRPGCGGVVLRRRRWLGCGRPAWRPGPGRTLVR